MRTFVIFFYQKQKTAMKATRIGFFTFFKLGWSNKVESTPWGNKVVKKSGQRALVKQGG